MKTKKCGFCYFTLQLFRITVFSLFAFFSISLNWANERGMKHLEILQQKGKVSGKVVSNNGEPLIGATVREEGTMNGKAGRYIKQYITEMEKALKESGLPLSMDGEPEAHRNGYLSEVCMERYKELFDKAENAVRDQPEFLKRVRKERMAIMYAQIRLEYGSIAERKRLLDEFIHLAENNNIWMLSEVDWREDQSGNREMFYNKTLKSLYEQ